MSAPLRLAYFSPLPPSRSGIADYSRELLPHLCQHTDITVFTDNPDAARQSLSITLPVMDTGAFAELRWRYDLALYQMGNSAHHDRMYQMSLRYPGIAVLHDYGLHHLLAYRTWEHGDQSGYMRELGYGLGPPGVALARGIIAGRQSCPFFEVPLNDRLLDRCLGLIVHSHWTYRKVRRQGFQRPVAAIPAPISIPAPPAARRPVDGWPEDAIVFASAGQITAIKRIDQALTAFARLLEVIPKARFLVIGEWLKAEIDLAAMVSALGLRDAVRLTGFVEDLAEFCEWLGAADVVLNLRYPTVGETSATALRALAAARPLIVYDHGWYSELPDEACIKLPPNDIEALFRAMYTLALDAELRRRLGDAGARYVVRVHSLEHAAAAYADFVRGLLRSLAMRGA